jgi:hypothetical protein
MHIYNIYDDELIINSDGNSLPSNPQILTVQDAVNAIQMFADKVKSGKMYCNSDSMKGGSVFRDALHHIRGMLPKVLPAIHRAMQFYDEHKGKINTVAHHGANLVDKYGDSNNPTHKSVSQMLHELKRRTA